jgi:hypothetical protein
MLETLREEQLRKTIAMLEHQCALRVYVDDMDAAKRYAKDAAVKRRELNAILREKL